MRIKLILGISVFFILSSCRSISSGWDKNYILDSETIEDFEDDFHWFPQSSMNHKDHSISCEATDEWSSSGTSSCCMITMPSNTDEISSFATYNLQLNVHNEIKCIIADILNVSSDAISIWFEFEGNDGSYRFRSEEKTLNPGENLDNCFEAMQTKQNESSDKINGSNSEEAGKFSVHMKTSAHGQTIFLDNLRIKD